jgi:hypothetical protein
MKQFFKTVFASTLGVLVALGIVTMGSIFFIIGVAASADGSSEYKPDKNTVFKLSLDGVLVDQAVKNPFSELMGESSNQMAVSDVIKAIRRAKVFIWKPVRFLQALQGLRRSAASWRTLRIAVSLSCHTAIIIRRGLITCVA